MHTVQYTVMMIEVCNCYTSITEARKMAEKARRMGANDIRIDGKEVA